MTKEAPERLWIEWAGGEIEGVEAFGYLEKQPFTFEYLRADLVPGRAGALHMDKDRAGSDFVLQSRWGFDTG